MNKIIIYTVEGDESYTEVNFFKGIIDQEQALEIICFGLAKARKKEVKRKNQMKISRFCNSISEFKDDIWIFCIGDGEVGKDIDVMKQTCDDTKIIFADNLIGKLHFHKLILPENKKFEQEINFNFPTKAGTYLEGFKHFLDDKNMWIRDKIDWQKLLQYFDKTVYKEIFRKLYEFK